MNSDEKIIEEESKNSLNENKIKLIVEISSNISNRSNNLLHFIESYFTIIDFDKNKKFSDYSEAKIDKILNFLTWIKDTIINEEDFFDNIRKTIFSIKDVNRNKFMGKDKSSEMIYAAIVMHKKYVNNAEKFRIPKLIISNKYIVESRDIIKNKMKDIKDIEDFYRNDIEKYTKKNKKEKLSTILEILSKRIHCIWESIEKIINDATNICVNIIGQEKCSEEEKQILKIKGEWIMRIIYDGNYERQLFRRDYPVFYYEKFNSSIINLIEFLITSVDIIKWNNEFVKLSKKVK